ncbi:MAG: serine/threonine-protein kinase, partial [Persicimonas sp.]
MSQTAATDRVDEVEIPGVELLEELGRGAHSIVYRARLDEQDCAVKIHRDVPGTSGTRHTLRYRREAAILARFTHPGLARIIEAGETVAKRRAYLIMEYVDGATLAEVIAEQGALEQARVVELAKIVASALAEVHAHGLVHRDIKPNNILVRAADGMAKLIDFGFAARTKYHEPDGSVVGTLRYSAPEQTGMLRRPVDARSDLYSLGVVLYECATGTLPFDADEPAEIVRQHAVDEPVAIRQLNAAITPALAAVIEKLIAKDPDDRYPSSRALQADLEGLDSLDEAFAEGKSMRLG